MLKIASMTDKARSWEKQDTENPRAEVDELAWSNRRMSHLLRSMGRMWPWWEMEPHFQEWEKFRYLVLDDLGFVNEMEASQPA